MTGKSPTTSKPTENKLWYDGVPRNIATPAKPGFALLALGFFGFGAWAGTAPIEGAVVAPGAFVATGENKIVQHLEGGIIKEILGCEGDLVKAGQPLIRLDETAAKSKLRRLILRISTLFAMQSRLRADTHKRRNIDFPEALLKAQTDEAIADIVDSQIQTFAASREKMRGEIAILRQGIAAFQEQMNGSRSQLVSLLEQVELIGEELKGKQTLFEKGLTSKTTIFALQRSRSGLRGDAGRLESEVGDIKERIARARRQMTNIRQVQVQQAVEQLNQVDAEIQDVQERMHSARDIANQIDINAPVNGIVVKMRYHTAGGVIEPGRDILELLPVNVALVIEANIRPQDIDNVRNGQNAYIRLTALNQRITPMIPGKVVYVSTDAMPDEKTGRLMKEDVYVAWIQLDAEKVAEVESFNPTPGMPTAGITRL